MSRTRRKSFTAIRLAGGRLGEGPIALIGAPIELQERVVGVVLVERAERKSDPAICEEDARFLTMIGALIGQTLHLYDIVTRDRERLMEEQRRLDEGGAASPRRRTANIR